MSDSKAFSPWISSRGALLLDLDGTLVDSVPDLAAAANELLAELGTPPLDQDEIAGMVGDGATKLVERALAARGLEQALIAPGVARFLALYEPRAALLSRPYPGVVPVLSHLVAEGWRCAVCTNKPLAPTRVMLRDLALDRFFGAVIAGDSLAARKPDPGPLLAALGALGAGKEHAVTVGDHGNDLRAAAAAGIPAIWARYGYGTLSADVPPPASVIDAFTELPERLAELRPA